MEWLGKFLLLPSAERHLLVRAAILLWAIRLGMWLLPFQTLRRLLAGVTHASQGMPDADRSLPDRIAWAVAVASRYVARANCLTQGLAVQLLLEREGYPARLQIGVARSAEGWLRAHAWVESQGKIVVGGGEHSHYVPLRALEKGYQRDRRHLFP